MKRRILLLTFFILFIISLSAIVVKATNDLGVELPGVASIGETYEIPEYKNGLKKAESRVITPNGSVSKTTTLNITTYGVYKVEYLIDGAVVESKEIVVNMRPQDLFKVNNQVTGVNPGSFSYKPTTKEFSGVEFDIRSDAKIEYTNTINVKGKTKDDILTEFIIRPNKTGSYDFGRVILTYTSITNPEDYFELVLSAGNLTSGNSPANSYLRGAGPNQKSGGFEGSKFNTIDFYGSPVLFSFSGEDRDVAVHDYSMKIYYDEYENAIYAYWYGTKRVVVDFDDSTIFGSNVWLGFKDGLCNLTVTFDKFASNNGHIIFTQIDGVDLSTRTIKDIVAPEIRIDYLGEKSFPNSYVGATYKIFNATCEDFFDMDPTLNVAVKYNNQVNDSWLDVSVEDGMFITDKVGTYKIIYTAKDNQNNVRTLEYEIKSSMVKNDISISGLNDGTVSIYDSIDIESGLSIIGGYGNLKTERVIESPSGKLIECDSSDFIPTEIGNYKITYKVSDFFGNEKTYSFNVNATRIDGVKFIDTPIFKDILITGFTYEIPKVNAVLCDGNTVKDANVSVYINGEVASGDSFKVKKGIDSVSIEYKAKDLNGAEYSLNTITIPVIYTESGMDQAKYFYDKLESLEIKEEESSVLLDIKEDLSFEFANVLNRDYFEIEFLYSPLNINFKTMVIKLVDSIDMTLSQTMTLDFMDDEIYLSTNNVKGVKLESKVALDKFAFAIGFDNYTKKVKDYSGSEISKFTIDDNGNEFIGFKKGLILYVDFIGVNGNSEIEITKINNQYFGYSDIDYPVGDETQPEIVYNGVYNTRVSLGDTVRVLSADTYDVLNQIDEKTVTVYSPSGEKVVDNKPIDTEYTFTATEIGNYKIIYNVKDTCGNEMKYRKQVLISVSDNVKPELIVNAKYNSAYMVGSRIEIPTFEVSDNNGSAMVDILLEMPTGEIRFLTHFEDNETISFLSKDNDKYSVTFKGSDTSFILEEAGEYKIIVMAYDDFYNYVLSEYSFVAVK